METELYDDMAKVVGFGIDLVDFLRRYRRFKSREDRKEELKKFVPWMQNCPHSDNICFVDVTFFSSMANDALTLTISPKVQGRQESSQQTDSATHNESLYEQVLKKDFLKDGNVLAAHPVFRAGLPRFLERTPGTESELDELWQAYDRTTDTAKKLSIQNGMFIHKLPKHAPARPAIVPDHTFDVGEISPYEDCFSSQELGNIGEQWTAWIQAFTRRRFDLCSAVEEPIGWLLAAPVGNRDFAEPKKYILSSCVFLAFDVSLNVEQVNNAVRYILLYLHTANAAESVKEIAEYEGNIKGNENAQRQLAHQIKDVGFGIGTGWNVSQETWEAIESDYAVLPRFEEHRKRRRIVPVPELYEAVQATLILWSLTYRIGDLFVGARVPPDLAAIVDRAWDFAIKNNRVSAFRNKNFEVDPSCVTKAWEDDAIRTGHIDPNSRHHLAKVLVKRERFLEVGSRTPDDAVRRYETTCQQLATLLRVFVIACENFLHHASTTLTIRVMRNADRFVVTCSNPQPATPPSMDRPMHLGFRGFDLIRHLCKTQLRGDAFKTDDASDPFVLTIDIEHPDWIRREGLHD